MKITLETSAGTFIKEYAGPVLLSKVLSDCGVFVASDCGGRGVCGKCRVKADGVLSPLTETEKLLLGDSGKLRLACVTTAYGDAHIIYSTKKIGLQVLSEGIKPDIKINGENTFTPDGVGAAIDIGTTTVAAASFNLATGVLTGTYTYENPQRAHGADVVTRMDFASRGGFGILRDEINGVITKIVAASKAEKIAVTGNTAMLHFAAGLSTDRMSKAPFEPESLFGCEIDDIYYSPCASAYFGADIVCGMAACGMAPCGIKREAPSFIADIGTNGELAVFDGEKYYCCSTAAGPCFEGCGIERGMPASDGAVNRVYFENGALRFDVIGGGKPHGLCGSALADYAAALLGAGIIDKSGYMEENHVLCENVYLTPRDVRNLQLAKAAIRAGIETLLTVSGTRGRIKKFFLAGGLGSSVDVRSAATIGLIPAEFVPVAVPAGNASLSGASASLLDVEFLRKTKEIAQRCEIIELADSELFGENFINYMALGD